MNNLHYKNKSGLVGVSQPSVLHTPTRGGSWGAGFGGGCCCCCRRRHTVAWEMKSKLALDSSECGHGQPEASDVVGVGRRQADPRLGGGLGASWLSVACRERERERERERGRRKVGSQEHSETRRGEQHEKRW